METTFITIHDLSPEARILYSSDSIVDVLGYSPQEVSQTSCWDYFHPEEVDFARARYEQGVMNDKAAMLSYCRMRDREGYYLGCECVFTIVYDCMVGCTSIYRRGLRSANRAVEAPVIRRLFSTSPRDPRYHMLAHLSTKFEAPVKPSLHEPRAALFLNRYTRTLAIMYATNGLKEELGITGDQLMGRSFYHCIDPACLNEAVRCLENAKANDSIAYLRFWFRDPRQDDVGRRRRRSEDSMEVDSADAETSKSTRSQSEDTEMGGVKIEESTPPALSPSPAPALTRHNESSMDSQAVSSENSVEPVDDAGALLKVPEQPDSRTSSGDSMEPQNTTEHIFGEAPSHESSESSASASPLDKRRPAFEDRHQHYDSLELEAVVSCTSDGMVVCLRRARAPVPLAVLDHIKESSRHQSGTFAVPWATEPIMPDKSQTSRISAKGIGANSASAAAPSGQDFMNSIREIAVFAWALTGINGSLAQYSRGQPRGESQPAQGLPIWQPNAAEEEINAMQTRDQAQPGVQRP